MAVRKPVIGITPGFDQSKDSLFINNGYMNSIIKAGGLPLLLPLTLEASMNAECIKCIENKECTQYMNCVGCTECGEFMEGFDGFLISGGPDIDARLFGEENLPVNGEISPQRDSFEMKLAKETIRRNKPVLGICRGIQVMNTAMGGSLYQDIYSQLPHRKLLKHSQNAPKWYPVHEIKIERDSFVHESFLCGQIAVNSFHHQAIKSPAPGFDISSRSSDGIIESIEFRNHKFAVGVQWHPELMWQENIIYLKLFELFVDHCRK